MPSTYVSTKHAAATANGTNQGVVTIASTVGWLPGATVWLSSTAQAGIECIIVEQVSATQLRLRKKTPQPTYGNLDASAFLTADGAALDLEGQVVPVLQVFTPRDRA